MFTFINPCLHLAQPYVLLPGIDRCVISSPFHREIPSHSHFHSQIVLIIRQLMAYRLFSSINPLRSSERKEISGKKHREMRSLNGGILGFVLVALFVSCLFEIGLSTGHDLPEENPATEAAEMVPLVEPGKVEMRVMLNDSRRKLGSFQVCSLCTCCGGASKSYCLPSPCCYAINCNIPNRPFGFCSFTPKTCNCFGCHI